MELILHPDEIPADLFDCFEEVNADIQQSVFRVSTEPLREQHFAAYPSELVRKCLVMATSSGGCCAACGASYAPIVESERMATRPALSNINDDTGMANRDPERHVAVTKVLGHKPTCSCGAGNASSIVLDPFVGSGTTVIVARRLGLRAVGLDASADYANMARRRIRNDLPLLNQ